MAAEMDVVEEVGVDGKRKGSIDPFRGGEALSEDSMLEGGCDYDVVERPPRYLSDLGVSGCGDLLPASPSRLSLEHSKTLPARSSSSSQLYDSRQCLFSRSRTEKKETLKTNMKLDKLSEEEKKMILESLIKIQKDGTVEVDVTHSEPVASELLEIDSIDAEFIEVGDAASDFTKLVPRLKIVILVVGTRGDVQPFLALAKRLQEFGHNVRLATHAIFAKFVKSTGVDFYPLGGDPRVMARYMVKTKGFLISGPAEISEQRKQLKEIINSIYPACTEPDLESGAPFRAQAIIANPPAYGHAHVAEALGVPLHIYFTMPWTPTREFSHPLARIPQSAGYRLSYLVVDLAVWWAIRGYINDFRKRKLKLAPIAYFSTYYGSLSHLPTGYMWSPHFVPKPNDWGALVDVVGYCFLNLGTKYEPPRDLTDWIELGPKPIYIGFGSMLIEDALKTTTTIIEALKETGQRGVIAQGWGDLGMDLEMSEDIFLLDDCPHDWLFPQCIAVVHHGGAGTVAAGLRAGCPTTVVPFFGDQFFWGNKIHERGVGPEPIPMSHLTTERLADAIRFMLDPEVKLRAFELSKLINNEDGVAAAVSAFHRHLPPEVPLLPAPSNDIKDQQPHPFQWVLRALKRWCCVPCFW